MSQIELSRFAWKEHLNELEIRKWREIQKFSDKLSGIILLSGGIIVAVILLLQRWPTWR
jgi:hypothetical protein